MLPLASLSLILNCIRDFVEIAATVVNWFMFHISEIVCPPSSVTVHTEHFMLTADYSLHHKKCYCDTDKQTE